MGPNSDEAIIRQRMINIVLSIRPLPSSVRPSDEFVTKTRNMLLGKDRPVSLLMHRRQRTLARLEEFTKKKPAS